MALSCWMTPHLLIRLNLAEMTKAPQQKKNPEKNTRSGFVSEFVASNVRLLGRGGRGIGGRWGPPAPA